MSKESLKSLVGKWNQPIPIEGEASSIQLRTYRLYFVPLMDYSIDDLRFMIVQKIGLGHLVPIAISYLKENILIEGNYYEGDLLNSILLIPKEFWQKNTKFFGEVFQLLLNNKEQLDSLLPSGDAKRNLIKNYRAFIESFK